MGRCVLDLPVVTDEIVPKTASLCAKGNARRDNGKEESMPHVFLIIIQEGTELCVSLCWSNETYLPQFLPPAPVRLALADTDEHDLLEIAIPDILVPRTSGTLAYI